MEANYQNYLRHSGEARFQDCFHLFFQDVKMGAVILNQDMTVLQTNKAAQEISQVFWEQYRHNQGHFLRSNYQGDPKFREVQTMINEISDRLTTQGGTSQTFTSLSGDISFYHTSFLSSSAGGLIQTWHLMFITCQTKELPKNLNHPYNTLTQQERRIVYYLSSGMKNEQIAEELHISIYTVRTHIANIYKKFEVNNKVDLLMHLQPIMKEQGTWTVHQRTGQKTGRCAALLSGPQLVALPLGDHQVLPGQLGQGPLDLPEGEPQPLGQGAGGGGDVVGEVFQNLLPGEFFPGKGPVGEGEGEVGALCVGGLGQHRGRHPCWAQRA